MSQVVIYWSGTGNTQAGAEKFAELLNCDIFEVTEFNGDFSYDTFILGCPAMGDEELEELDFDPFFSENIENFKGKKIVIFGSYSWNDGQFMEIWLQRCIDNGLEVIDSLAYFDYPDDAAFARIEEICGKIN